MFSGVQKDKDRLQKKFGKHLKEVLKKKGLKPIELAKQSFMDKQQISALIRGERNVTLYTLTVICKALEMTFVEFFEGYED